MRLTLVILAVMLGLAALVVWPQADLITSGIFYRTSDGFFLRDVPSFDAVHVFAHAGSRIIGLFLLVSAIMAAVQRKPVMGLSARAWLFLLLGLLIGPALLANGLFKEYWGRARPRDILQFGGTLNFSPPLLLSNQCEHNCSFVAGDGAFGFYFSIFSYVVALANSRRVFWGGLAIGLVFGFVRVAVGAHFLSDVLYAGFFMQAVFALLHGLMFGWADTRQRWRYWLFLPEKSIA